MILSFHPVIEADVQIILGPRPLEDRDRALIQGAEAVILPQACPRELYQTCKTFQKKIFPNYEARFKYPGKTGQCRLFKALGLSHPDTACWASVDAYLSAHPEVHTSPHAFPFLFKSDHEHEGEGVFLIASPAGSKKALDHLAAQEKAGFYGFVTQSFVPSGGNVLRAVIAHRKVVTYWKRAAKPGHVIITISRGAILDHTWAPAKQEQGRRMAMDLREKTGINLAAVDFLFPQTPEANPTLFLEINYFFGRRGLGGSASYYGLLLEAVRTWLAESGLDADAVRLI